MSVLELINEYNEVNNRRNYPVMADEELIALADDFGKSDMFVTVKCIYKGVPSVVRVVSNKRQGTVEIHVDAKYQWFDTADRLERLTMDIGRATITEQNSHS